MMPKQEEVIMATLILVWVCVVAAIGTFMLAMLREKIMDQGLWMLWGVFIGGIGVALPVAYCCLRRSK